ncbi:MAG: M56 family metallopeptidase [Isosphaeraceae bacterium]
MSPSSSSMPAAWTAAGWTMLHMVWIGAVGGIGSMVLRRLLRPSRPEIRHGAAVTCLLMLALAPGVLFARLYRPEAVTTPTSVPVPRLAEPGADSPALPDLSPALASHRLAAPPAPVAAPIMAFAARFEPMVGYLPGVWLSGSLATLALVATGLVGVDRLRRSSRPLEADAIAARCRALAASLGIARRVGVAICDRIATPVLIGVVRPMILLPPAALCGWSIEQLEMALLHELAHVRRHDNLIALLQRLVESLLFFHPAAWWISSWVGLERELCCDRLVIEHTGRPRDYARMLAAMAGVVPAPRTAALAMAARPLLTRIRLILDMEDRSMKLTLKEWIGGLAAAVAVTAIMLAAHAGGPEPHEPNAADKDRQALARLSASILAQPDGRAPHEGKASAMVEVARAFLQIGDRASALEILRRIDRLAGDPPPKLTPDVKHDLRGWERFAALAESARLWREAGDTDGARKVLARAGRMIEALDGGTVRDALERVGKEIDKDLARVGPDGPRRLNDEEAAFIAEASLMLIDQYVALGDMATAREQIAGLRQSIEPLNGSIRFLFDGVIGGYMIRAGDRAGGRELIDRACRDAKTMTDARARSSALAKLVATLAEAHELDRALAIVRELSSEAQQPAFGQVLDTLSDDDHTGPWLDPVGINIKIVDRWRTPKDPATTRAALPKIAEAARASGSVKVQARVLGIIAHLQARAGDIPGALATARSIPALRRSDFPGPSDGFYDAVKPVALAMIASVQAAAGDRLGASAALGEAEAIARPITAEDQKLIAMGVIAMQRAELGQVDMVRTIVGRCRTLALAQDEPRRSRVLLMLAEAQIKAGNETGALELIDAIRDYPGLEKARGLTTVADRREKAGDANSANELRRRAVALLEAKAPDKPRMGKASNVNAIGRDTFIDFDLEMAPGFITHHRDRMLDSLRVRAGDLDGAIRSARALPPPKRDAALTRIAGDLANRGDVAHAAELVQSIDSLEARMGAFVSLAYSIRVRNEKK